MEPFRPAVDLIARRLRDEGATEVDPAAKAQLAGVLHQEYATANGRTALSYCLSRLCGSLARVYLKEGEKLDLPRPLIPLINATLHDEAA